MHGFLKPQGRGYGFLGFILGFPPFSFTVYIQQLSSRNCKRLSEFEEIEFSRQSCSGDCE
jgi:hypothetical protein